MRDKLDTVVILDQASGYLQIDMLEAYRSKYKNLVIVAGTVVERGTPLASDVIWHKIVKYDRSSSFKRIMTWIRGAMGMFWHVLTKYRGAHIVSITNPPFSVFVPWILGCRFDVIVYDMYPDALAHYGYTSQKSTIYKLWARLNKRVFQKANQVFTLTSGMKKLVNQYLNNDDKVIITPLWSDASDFKRVARSENEILKITKSRDKFNIVYSGNWGKTHPVESLIDLAEHLEPEKFAIIIIGGGAKERMLHEKRKSKGLPHVHLLPWQPVQLLSHSLQAADLSVVTLDEQASDLSIPSKTFNILTVGNPVLGICSSKSSLAELIKMHECGIVNSGESLENLANEIAELESNANKIELLKENSLKASENFTKANALVYV
jgi:glycosyltransferase involved in cell wall biosynthesis